MTTVQVKLILVLSIGFGVGCTDDESIGQRTPSDIVAMPITNDAPATKPDCVDLISANADWSDNCVLSIDHPYSHSTYLLGVQRLLWCTEAFSDSSLTMSQVADGLYSERTKDAIQRYQRRNALPSSGSVDVSTWYQLQQELTLIGAAAAEYSSFAVVGARCNQQIHFYQRNTEPHDWKIAAQPGSIELLNFSGLEREQ